MSIATHHGETIQRAALSPNVQTYSSPQDPAAPVALDEIDQKCLRLIRNHEAGLVDSAAARNEIAVLLEQSRIAYRTARHQQRSFRSTQRTHDLGVEMNQLLFTKVMQDDGSGLNLDSDLCGSVVGWARQLLKSAHLSLLRNIDSRSTRHTLLTTPDEMDTEAAPRALYLSDDESDLGNLEEAMDWFAAKSRSLRDATRIAAAAAAIQHSISVPALIRPDYNERQILLPVVEANSTLAHRTALAYRTIHDGNNPPETDSRILALWDGYTYDQLDRIVSSPPGFAHALALAALSVRPRPIRNTLRDFRARIKAHGAGRGWATLTGELAECFVALEFEAYSGFDTRGIHNIALLESGQTLNRAKAGLIYGEIANYPGQTLGSTRAQIHESLDDIMNELAAFKVSAPQESHLAA